MFGLKEKILWLSFLLVCAGAILGPTMITLFNPRFMLADSYVTVHDQRPGRIVSCYDGYKITIQYASERVAYATCERSEQ